LVEAYLVLSLKSNKLKQKYYKQIEKTNAYDKLRVTKVKQNYEFKDL